VAALGFPEAPPHGDDARARAEAAAADLRFCQQYGLIETADGHMRLAWLYHGLGRPVLVEQHLRRALARDPDLPAAHFNLGKALLRQRRLAEAERAFAEAVRLAPALADVVPATIRRAPHPG
jgi:tetratricopeptide (TPR) repeat protein